MALRNAHSSSICLGPALIRFLTWATLERLENNLAVNPNSNRCQQALLLHTVCFGPVLKLFLHMVIAFSSPLARNRTLLKPLHHIINGSEPLVHGKD